LLQRLTFDKQKDVRLSAVKALAWFPEAATGSASSVPFITRDHLVPEELANAILYLGIFDRYLPDYSDVSWLREQLWATRAYLVLVERLSACFQATVSARRSDRPTRAKRVLDASVSSDRSTQRGSRFVG
jgi:hypothetical protein